ncbi:MAG TPA: tyrosine-type recombinase/integrase [Myxococcota bacterium]|nr:tyrosine-type recombinase/integrase [Myxococcota bacterium]
MTARMKSFGSLLGPSLSRYLALKEALGRRYSVERDVLRHFDAFLASRGTDLSSETFAGWCQTQQHLASGVRRKRMRIVRNFCLYRRRSEPSCFVPDPVLFPSSHQPVRPHIFTEAEIVRLLHASDTLQPASKSPLRRETFRLAIVLLYTAGLRRGELVRLMISDYDPQERTLLVRESKFHKSRLLPLSEDASRAVDAYLKARQRRHFPISKQTPLLWNHATDRRSYTGSGVGQGVSLLLRAAGIRTATGRLPRVHDLRHSFAVHALLRWYRTGENVQAKLPFLATYMGHVSIVSTEYYLQFTQELADLASERFARRYGALVTPPPSGGAA